MPRPLPDFVTCGHCGDTWPLTTRPYPLANGICHDCRRILKKPNYMLAAENERLKAEVERLSADRDRFGEALEAIRDTDPVDAALDPDRARRIAREALRTEDARLSDNA